jgi:hypothetical protein
MQRTSLGGAAAEVSLCANASSAPWAPATIEPLLRFVHTSSETTVDERVRRVLHSVAKQPS